VTALLEIRRTPRTRGVRAAIGVASRPVTGVDRSWERAMTARIVAGDDRALEAVVDRYGPLVHAIAARLVGREHAADVTQEVFLTLWTKPDAYHPDAGALRTFLAVAARRRAIDELRSRGRRAARELRTAAGGADASPDAEDAAITKMSTTRVRAALAKLPDEQRWAIELAYYGGLTCTDVARVCGIPDGTAKSRIRLGLGRLARELAELADGGEMQWT
jgi:RNA polymerase sigma-70 factor (ECF subfamily)